MFSNRKIWITLAFEILVLLVFVFSFFSYQNKNFSSEEVIGYAKTMEVGSKITEADLIPIPMALKDINPESMMPWKDRTKIVGQYATTKVFAKNIAYKEQIDTISMGDDVSLLDLQNSRILSIPISLVESIAGDLKKGEKIDLMFSGKMASGEGENEYFYSKIFLQDIPVYQVNSNTGHKYVSKSNLAPGEKGANSTTEADKGADQTIVEEQELASISLVVTPEQAEQIEARRQAGVIKLIKRFNESETHETLGFVIGDYNKVFSGNANPETGNVLFMDQTIGLEEETNNGTVTVQNGDETQNNQNNNNQGEQ